MKTKRLLFLCIILTILVFSVKSQNVSYIKIDATLSEVKQLPSADWVKLDGEVYEGQKNGIYWFKIELSNISEDLILSIPYSHVTHVEFYGNNQLIPELQNRRYCSFKIPMALQIDTYYLMVNCLKEAVIPIKFSSIEDETTFSISENLIIGAYYGFILAVIVFNLFSYYTYRYKTYLFYILMLLFVDIPLAIRDGLFNLFLSPHIVNEIIEPTSHIILGGVCCIFTWSYLNVNDHLPRYKWVAISGVALSLVTFVAYLITRNFLVYSFLSMSVLLILTICWYAGIQLFRENAFAKFYTIAYGLILFSSYDTYIAPHFGFKVLDLSLHEFRVGAGFEMLVFAFAISYSGIVLAKENREMRNLIKQHTYDLELSRWSTNFNLTLQEIKVVQELIKDQTNLQIASSLFVSVNTVKYHTRNIYQKLGIHSRDEAKAKLVNSVL